MPKDKKGEILNQLALISDLLEKVNLKGMMELIGRIYTNGYE